MDSRCNFVYTKEYKMLNIEKKLDKAFQKLAKGKKCFYCDNHASEIHHLVRRSYALYRYDKRNALPVCRNCHNAIHFEGLKEPPIPFEREDIREYLMQRWMIYEDFLKLKAKEYGIKYTDKDFEKVRNPSTTPRQIAKNATTEFYKKVMEFKRKQRKEAYQKSKLAK